MGRRAPPRTDGAQHHSEEERTFFPSAFRVSPKIRVLTDTVINYFRSLGIRCLGYIDDYVFAAESEEIAKRLAVFVRHTLANLGLVINDEKSHLSPSQRIEALGIIINTKDHVFEAPADTLGGARQST